MIQESLDPHIVGCICQRETDDVHTDEGEQPKLAGRGNFIAEQTSGAAIGFDDLADSNPSVSQQIKPERQCLQTARILWN